MNESFSQQLKELEAELSSQENVVEDALKDSSETQKAYSIVEEELEAIEARLKEIEDEQIGLSDSLSKIEKTMPMLAKSQHLCQPFACH